MSETTWQQPGETGQVDPRTLIERAAITDVVIATGLFYDAGEFELLADLYTVDATFAMDPAPEGFPEVISTREQIAGGLAMLRQLNLDQLGVHSRHATSNVLITGLSEDTADVYSIVTVTGVYPDQRFEFRRLGNYVDRLHREGTRWRIASRRLHLLSSPPLRTAAATPDPDQEREPAA